MRLPLLLCVFGIHKWQHYHYHWTYPNKQRTKMQSSRRKCLRCNLRQDFNRLRSLSPNPQSPWKDLPKKQEASE